MTTCAAIASRKQRSKTEKSREQISSRDKIEAELSRLSVDPISRLRLEFKSLFKQEPPRAFGPDLLRRIIARRIQGNFYGHLQRDVQRQLDTAIKAAPDTASGALQLPRQIRAGAELVRDWKGKTHRVMVRQKGFAYAGKAYDSLSEIASLITGTNWNGPRFFGLRSKTEGAAANGK